MADEDRVKWQGSNPKSPQVTVCEHMVPKLQVMARNTGANILVRSLNSSTGSFQTLTEASANTHAGGGALDVDMRGLNRSQARFYETVGRKAGLLFYWRPAVKGLWTDHGHVLDPGCGTLSVQAAAQFPLFAKGFDALVGNHSDTGDRSQVAAIMREFDSRNPRASASNIYTVRAGDTLGRIATKFNTTVAKLQTLNHIANPNLIFVGQRIRVR